VFRSDGDTRRVHVVDDVWHHHPGRPHLVLDALALTPAATPAVPCDLDGVPLDDVAVLGV
jgi:hypothetical protein